MNDLKFKLLPLFFSIFFAVVGFTQNTENLGEDFDLEALPSVLEKVSDFEALEKAINEEGNDVNNLDLDGNGEVDYVLIQMENDGDTYIAYLRVATSETEFQDVATLEMEKKSSATATFQIVGDEALYGKDYILEPEGGIVDISESSSSTSGGKGGPSPYIIPPPPAVRVSVCVGVFRPGFVIFVSPYGFHVRPVWFRPWRPLGRSTFRARSSKMHRKSFRRTSSRRSSKAHGMQKNGRKTSKKSTTKKSTTKKSTTKKSSTTKKNTSSSAAKTNNKTTAQPNKSTQQRSNTQSKGGAKKGGKR